MRISDWSSDVCSSDLRALATPPAAARVINAWLCRPRPLWHRQPNAEEPSMSEQTLTLSLSTGDVVIRLRPDLAPKHVERITELASEGFYDGVVFHRVIPGFMAPGGDPTGTGSPEERRVGACVSTRRCRW